MKYDKEWYDSLVKPKFQPPAWVFAPVWTVLYISMFIAAVLVLAAKFHWINIFAYLLFTAQLTVNLLWTPAFFGEHNLRKAFLLSSLLSLLVFLTMLFFYHISKFAGILFLPYFLWCLFATVLNFEILELNEW
ncbi:MAG: tryptophan-rich sensory protein [Candidatus Gastranaerophilales bacterium]|nr:tryptophan-rich sensory protein [Candidatus Gastranaerophilales bacterium]